MNSKGNKKSYGRVNLCPNSVTLLVLSLQSSSSLLLIISAMMSQGASRKPWMPKLTLESYLNLEHMDVISPHLLRKILMIHGFKSCKVPKADLIDAVRSIELMGADHSTLQSDVVSSNAFLSLNDVIRDLSLLHWQECCITSIETINSETDFGSEVGEESSPKLLKPDCNTASSSKKIKHEVHTAQPTVQQDDPQAQTATLLDDPVDQNQPK
ncbi:hypothetical protein L1987_18255 [Smallanthus sonchifolius]|uniref:Uncharacterized protein n=1 Tax=Smallanthus sonchifolius TaxID=185202 RepID=A0ACB9J028_9ASTR|nr:hypothetical protein L1987_18255 [Smallanthus sonchifolius]